MSKIKGFTLVEIIVSITLFAIILVITFDVMGNISISRTKLSNRLDINQDIFVAIESIVNNIKDFDGDIDYEEYWNRNAVGITNTNSGHYSDFTGYGNYGTGGNFITNDYGDYFYYCISGIGIDMGAGGCLTGFNTSGGSMLGAPQRFGEYTFQFIDYNSNKNDDPNNCLSSGNPGMQIGDENCDGNIRGDDDDENLGEGPLVFSGNEVKEVYLIRKGKTNERFFMRLNIINDPDAISGATCDSAGVGSGCLGNIQILKLNGKDLGMSHSGTITSSGRYDGVIDTWQCGQDYSCNGTNNLPNNTDDGWINLLPNYINVKNFKVFIYPNSNYKYAWKNGDFDTKLNSYIRINIGMGYSWLRRKQIKMLDPTISISTTINLTKN